MTAFNVVLAIALVAILVRGSLRVHKRAVIVAGSLIAGFLPLFVTLGAASDPSAPVSTVIDGYWMGLAKRSFQVS